MFDPISLLITQGPLGVISAVILWLYLLERRRANDAVKQAQEMRDSHYKIIDEVRLKQIQREQEVAQILDEYGRSVVSAIDQTAFLAKELRKFHHEQK